MSDIEERDNSLNENMEIRELIQSLEQKIVDTTVQLHDSEERFKAVTDTAGDAIICLAKSDTIYLWNKKAEEIFGYSAADAIGKKLHELVVPEQYLKDAVKGMDNFYRSGTGPLVGSQLEISAIRKDGTEFPIELSISAMKVGDDWHATGIIRDITDRKQAEKALKESEYKYRSLFENMLDGFAYCKMLYDDHGRPVDFVYLDVNAAFERLTGLKDVIGKVSKVIPGVLESHPELLEIYSRVALTGNPERFEIDFKPLEICLIISVYSTAKGYFAAVFDNITSRKKAEEALRISENRFRQLFHGGNDAIFVYHILPDGQPCNFIEVNDVACERLGFTRDELLKMSPLDIDAPDMTETSNALIKNILRENKAIFEMVHVAKDGSRIPVEINVRIFDLGGITTVLAIARDITERKKTEEKFKNYISELERFKKATIQREFRIKELKERLERK